MQKHRKNQNKLFTSICLVLTGFGIGWLVGLSISPVVSIVITSITGTAVAIVAALSGLNKNDKDNKDDSEKAEKIAQPLQWEFDPIPIALLVIGLFFGSTLGIWVRTHSLLSPQPMSLIDEITLWTAAGMQKDVVVNTLFENKYPSSNSSTASQQDLITPPPSVLFAQAAQEECETLTTLVTKQKYEELQTELLSSAVPPWRELPTIVTDTVKLSRIVEKILCAATEP